MTIKELLEKKEKFEVRFLYDGEYITNIIFNKNIIDYINEKLFYTRYNILYYYLSGNDKIYYLNYTSNKFSYNIYEFSNIVYELRNIFLGKLRDIPVFKNYETLYSFLRNPENALENIYLFYNNKSYKLEIRYVSIHLTNIQTTRLFYEFLNHQLVKKDENHYLYFDDLFNEDNYSEFIEYFTIK